MTASTDTLNKAMQWMNWFTPTSFESTTERQFYFLHVQHCFQHNTEPLYLNAWRVKGTVPRRQPKHRAES